MSEKQEFHTRGNVEGTIRRIVAQAKEKGVVIQETSRQKLDELSQTKNHQGVIAQRHARPHIPLSAVSRQGYAGL